MRQADSQLAPLRVVLKFAMAREQRFLGKAANDSTIGNHSTVETDGAPEPRTHLCASTR
jgi:hypothetical protein